MAAAEITGLVLAGGRARRMQGRDKGLIELAGRPLVAYVIAALHNQVCQVLINANRNLARYAELGCPVIPDDTLEYLGPLAGLAAGMRAATTPYVLTVPCDSPLPAPRLAERLYASLKAAGAQAAMARDSERCQPLYALVDRSLGGSLRAAIDNGERRPELWLRAQGAVETDFADCPDMFVNLNDPAELQRLESRLAPDEPQVNHPAAHP